MNETFGTVFAILALVAFVGFIINRKRQKNGDTYLGVKQPGKSPKPEIRP